MSRSGVFFTVLWMGVFYVFGAQAQQHKNLGLYDINLRGNDRYIFNYCADQAKAQGVNIGGHFNPESLLKVQFTQKDCPQRMVLAMYHSMQDALRDNPQAQLEYKKSTAAQSRFRSLSQLVKAYDKTGADGTTNISNYWKSYQKETSQASSPAPVSRVVYPLRSVATPPSSTGSIRRDLRRPEASSWAQSYDNTLKTVEKNGPTAPVRGSKINPLVQKMQTSQSAVSSVKTQQDKEYLKSIQQKYDDRAAGKGVIERRNGQVRFIQE